MEAARVLATPAPATVLTVVPEECPRGVSIDVACIDCVMDANGPMVQPGSWNSTALVDHGTEELIAWLDAALDAGMPLLPDDRPEHPDALEPQESRHAPDYTDGSDWHYPRWWVDQ